MNDEQDPIVFCHGLFGWGAHELGGYPYFVHAHALAQAHSASLPRFIFPSTGPISSLHDQACELFYQLKGGRVNYGLQHSEKFGHERFSRDYSLNALYPQWDEIHPLDFVCHSMGAPVVRTLQYLLSSGFFSAEDGKDYQTSSRWIRSLTTIAGVHNGSTLTWLLGADEATGLVKKDAPLIRFATKLIEKYAAIQKRYSQIGDWYDLHLDQWGFGSDTGLREKIQMLLGKKSFVESEDWAMYDLSPNAMEKLNPILKEYPGTWYFSYVTRTTFSFFGLFEFPIPFLTRWFLLFLSFRLGTICFKSANWKKQNERNWRANDGVCPSYSQGLPHLGRDEPAVYSPFSTETGFAKDLPSGTWHIRKKLEGYDHTEIAMLPHFWRISAGMRVYKSILDDILNIRKIHE